MYKSYLSVIRTETKTITTTWWKQCWRNDTKIIRMSALKFVKIESNEVLKANVFIWHKSVSSYMKHNDFRNIIQGIEPQTVQAVWTCSYRPIYELIDQISADEINNRHVCYLERSININQKYNEIVTCHFYLTGNLHTVLMLPKEND